MQIEMKECRIDGQKRIALLFDYDINTIEQIKQIDGRKWSAYNKLWHIPYQMGYLKKLNNQFEGKLEFIKQKTESKVKMKESNLKIHDKCRIQLQIGGIRDKNDGDTYISSNFGG